jgi:hypothetical protein
MPSQPVHVFSAQKGNVYAIFALCLIIASNINILRTSFFLFTEGQGSKLTVLK